MSAVIIDEVGQVRVVQRRDAETWEIPGGVLELDESIPAGLRREVEEETGLLVEPGPPTGVYKNLRLGVVALVFRANIMRGQAQPTAESGVSALIVGNDDEPTHVDTSETWSYNHSRTRVEGATRDYLRGTADQF